MKKKLLFLISLLAALSLTNCGSGDIVINKRHDNKQIKKEAVRPPVGKLF